MAMATVTLSTPAGYNRADQPLHLDRSVIDEVEFDSDECDFAEALGDAGYSELVRANWIQETCTGRAGVTEHRCYLDGRIIYIAEVVS